MHFSNGEDENENFGDDFYILVMVMTRSRKYEVQDILPQSGRPGGLRGMGSGMEGSFYSVKAEVVLVGTSL